MIRAAPIPVPCPAAGKLHTNQHGPANLYSINAYTMLHLIGIDSGHRQLIVVTCIAEHA